MNRNTAYYQLNYSKAIIKEAEDLIIKDEIEKIQLEFPYYGYRMVTAELGRKGWKINRKKVQRIMRKYGIMSQIKKLFKNSTNSKHKLPKYPNLIKDLAINRLNQVWGADITYVRLENGFVYVAVIIDFFSRKIKSWAISKRFDHSLTIQALENALANNPAPDFHHSDQGVQYCCLEYVEKLKKQSIQISMSDKGNPYQNNITESFFKTLKYNEVYLNEYNSFEEAQSNIKHFIETVYHTRRLHSSLGYLPPVEFEKNCLNGQNQEILESLARNDALECSVSGVAGPR